MRWPVNDLWHLATSQTEPGEPTQESIFTLVWGQSLAPLDGPVGYFHTDSPRQQADQHLRLIMHRDVNSVTLQPLRSAVEAALAQ
jgi:hypothetical protein